MATDLQAQYRAACAARVDIPVFYQPWRLDALLGPEGWQAAVVLENNRLCGLWPYTIEHKPLMGKWLRQPPLMPYAGPLVLPPPDNEPLRAIGLRQYVRRVQEALWAQLPAGIRLIDTALHPSQIDAMRWAQAGCKLGLRYSYRLDLQNLDEAALWAGLRENIRRCVRKAERQVQVRIDTQEAAAFDTFLPLMQGTFGRQGLALPLPTERLRALDAAALLHQSRSLLLAYDAQNQHHAGLYMLHDADSAYLHMAGEAPALRHSEASILLIWRAILYTKDVLRLPVFDFEGSMLPGVERVYAAFGGELTPYVRLMKTEGLPMRLFYAIKGRY